MAWFRHLTIGQKFFVSFGFLLVLLAGSLAALLFLLVQINSYVDRHNRITVPALVTVIDIRQKIYEMTMLLPGLDGQSGGDQIKARSQLSRLELEVRSDLDRYRKTHAAITHPVLFGMLTKHEKTSLADQEVRTLDETAKLLSDFGPRWREVAARSRAQRKRTNTAYSDAEATARHLLTTVYRLVDLNAQITAEMKAEGDALLRQAGLVSFALIVLLGLVIVLFYVAAQSQVAIPLKRLADTADRVAHHELTASFTPWPARDEVGNLSRSLGTMLHNLRIRTRELERKTRELEAFTYSVAHDLKGPLREIEGFSSLIQQKFSEHLEPTARHYLSRIGISAVRMTHLINDLLRYSRLEQQTLPMYKVNLRTHIDQLVADRSSGEDSILVAVNHAFTYVTGDPTAIKQVLSNLLDNAIKFSRHASPPQISISGSVREGERIICIRDNGIGFDQNHAERIFGLFERLHDEEAYEGTGIGLAIVRLVMEKHGGRAWAESEPGKGSSFYLAFPEHAALETGAVP